MPLLELFNFGYQDLDAFWCRRENMTTNSTLLEGLPLILDSRSLCLILLKGSNLFHANNVPFLSMYRVSMMNSRQSFLRREEHLKINTRNYINHSIPRYADIDSSCPMPLIWLLCISFMLYMSHFLVSCFFWDTKAIK